MKKVLIFIILLIICNTISHSQDINYFLPNFRIKVKQETKDTFIKKITDLCKEYKGLFISNPQSDSQLLNDTAILNEIQKLADRSHKIIFTYELRDILNKMKSKRDLIIGEGGVYDEFVDKIRKTINNTQYSYMLNINTVAELGATDENLSPATNISIEYLFGKNAKRGDIFERYWGSINGNIDFALQSKTSKDSITALTKIINFGSDFNLRFNFKTGTSFEFGDLLIRFIAGGSLLASNLSAKKIESDSTNSFLDLNGNWMTSFNVITGLWFELSDEMFIITGYKYEKRSVSNATGWLAEQLNGAESTNFFIGVRYNEFQAHCKILIGDNRDTDPKQKIQLKLGTFLNILNL